MQVYDLRPITWRLKLEIAFQARNQGGTSSDTDRTTAFLGPLVDAGAATAGFTPANAQAQQTAGYVHAPTGHVAKAVDAAGLSRRAQYDIRDMTLSGETTTAGHFSVFKQSFAYENAPAGSQTFNGNIGEMLEAYGPITGTPFQNQRRYTYDLTSQLLGSDVEWNMTGNAASVANTYQYDANGNRLKEWRDNVPAGANSSPNGQNWELSHAVPQGKNRLTQVDLEIDNGGTNPYYESIAYDGIGNITAYTTRKNGSARNYAFSYDDARFPILPTVIEVTGSQPVRETFTYDHAGTRIKRELDADNNPATANEISYFIPYGTENLAELDARGRVRRATTFAGSERTGYKAAGRTVLYLKDHLGSTKMTLGLYASTLQAGLQQRAGDADPYGVTWRESYSATAESEPHQYTGQEREAALDLYYYGARFYDPDLGRFLAVDPARQYWNSYSYVGNNSTSLVDFDGTWGGPNGGEKLSLWERFKGWVHSIGVSVLDNGEQQWVNSQLRMQGLDEEDWAQYPADVERYTDQLHLQHQEFASTFANYPVALAETTVRTVPVAPIFLGVDDMVAHGPTVWNVLDITLGLFSIIPYTRGVSFAPNTGTSAAKALPAPRQVNAAWGVNTYRHGGTMSAIEHINYRHANNSGFSNVSRFDKGTSVRQIRGYVDEALRYGNVTQNGTSIRYDLGRFIGLDQAGNPVTGIQVYVRDGLIQTAFPVAP